MWAEAKGGKERGKVKTAYKAAPCFRVSYEQSKNALVSMGSDSEGEEKEERKKRTFVDPP